MNHRFHIKNEAIFFRRESFTPGWSTVNIQHE